jgi:hypothetical protein
MMTVGQLRPTMYNLRYPFYNPLAAKLTAGVRFES